MNNLLILEEITTEDENILEIKDDLFHHGFYNLQTHKSHF